MQRVAVMQGRSTATSDDTCIIGHRYLNGKTRYPLTLRYVGPLPPAAGPITPATPPQIWYGVEYDDPSKGKSHSGTHDGIEVFSTRQPGAGAFVKAGREGVLVKGKTFVEAVEERYGSIIPHAESSTSVTPRVRLVLGSSNAGVSVDAPNIDAVRERLGKLERLRQMGLEEEWVRELGGDDETRKVLRERLRGESDRREIADRSAVLIVSGVEQLNLSRNLLDTWEAVADIVACLPGLRTLALKYVLPSDRRYQTDTIIVTLGSHLCLTISRQKQSNISAVLSGTSRNCISVTLVSPGKRSVRISFMNTDRA